MRRKNFVLLLLMLCLMLCACAKNDPLTTPPAPPANTTEQQPSSSLDHGTTTVPEAPEQQVSVYIPAELTVELVVEWETADALLSKLDDMSEMLHLALEEVGYPMDRVTLTISTAGGFTADSLAQGGIDAAVLPAVDFLSCTIGAAGIAMSCEDVSETVIALTLAKGQPDSAFCAALFDALTKTDSGQEFIALCRPDATFAVPTEEAIQAVQDWVDQQEQNGGHLS